MNRFIGLIITVVAVAALVGAAIGWQFPFLGGNRSANQLGNSGGTGGRTLTAGNRARVQPANQQTTAPNNQTAQAPRNVTIDPEQPNTATGTSEANQPIPALW